MTWSVTSIDGDAVTLTNQGQLVLPAPVEVTYKDGSSTRFQVPAETWLNKGELTWAGEKPIARVTIDPEHKLPDDDRSNNMMSAN